MAAPANDYKNTHNKLIRTKKSKEDMENYIIKSSLICALHLIGGVLDRWRRATQKMNIGEWACVTA
jgi:hypothetical protein